MTEYRIVVSGFGGQGVMALGQILISAALHEGKEVIWIPSYGPEMRGGTANCTVIISDERIGSPVADLSDIAIVFNEPSFDEFENKVKTNGTLYVNSSLVKNFQNRNDIEIKDIPVNDIAKGIGNERTLNMVMLGYLLNDLTFINEESVKKGFFDVFGEKSEKLWDVNKIAIDTGKEFNHK